MAIAAVKPKPNLKTFYGIVHVTRAEEWFVEARTAEEARESLASGFGHRCQVGGSAHVKVDMVEG